MRVSIITPAYDVAGFVGDAVRSARAQSHADFELILVDDGSSDGTGDAAAEAAAGDPRIRILRQANAGVSAARNVGIAAATGEALLFLDADDWLAPDAAARLLAALNDAPGAVAAYGPWAAMAEASHPGNAPLRLKPGPFPSGDVLETLLARNLLVNGGHALIRRAAFDAAGGFHPGIRYGEDWECWIRLALQGPFAGLDSAPLLFVRERHNSAYRRLAHDPAAFAPAMHAIWSSPALAARLGPRLARLRARSEAENEWVVAKERLRHDMPDALPRLRAAFRAAPGPRRAALLAAAHLLPILPRRLHGAVARYEDRR